MNEEVCREFAKCPHESKQIKRVAEIMGLSHKQLKTAVEVFNPECFGQRTEQHGLTAGRAFDIVLGDDILQKVTQREITRYIYHPGQTRSCCDLSTSQIVFIAAEFVEAQT